MLFGSFKCFLLCFRREGYGNHYLCGRSPSCDEEEPNVTDNDVDYDFFDEKVWPVIANRAQCFENLKVTPLHKMQSIRSCTVENACSEEASWKVAWCTEQFSLWGLKYSVTIHKANTALHNGTNGGNNRMLNFCMAIKGIKSSFRKPNQNGCQSFNSA